MLFSVEQAFVGRDEKRAPRKTPAWWEARPNGAVLLTPRFLKRSTSNVTSVSLEFIQASFLTWMQSGRIFGRASFEQSFSLHDGHR